MKQITTNLDKLVGSLPLWVQYSGQNKPQPAYLEISADGRVFYGIDFEIGNAVPADVWHGVRRQVSIPSTLTARGYRDLHDEYAELIAAVAEGMGTRWDGSNEVGTLTPEAEQALEQLVEASMTGRFEDFEKDETALLELE